MGLGQGDRIAASFLRLRIGHRVDEIDEFAIRCNPFGDLNAHDFGAHVEVEKLDAMRIICFQNARFAVEHG